MNKSESKYFNTAIKMDEALITLLEKKDFEYITIKEICDIAGVNRSTFYLHYENTHDLLKETIKYILDKHFAYYNVDKKDKISDLATCPKEELVFITAEYLTPYLTFVKDNRRLLKVSMKHFSTMNMDEVYAAMFKMVFDPVLTRFGVAQNERSYTVKFYLTGVYAIVTEWLEKDCKDDINTVIKVITSCVLGERNIAN